MNEIQRLFLVSPDIERWLEKQTVSMEKTELFYADDSCYYVKQFPNTYTKVMVRSEELEEKDTVTEADYKLARQKHMGKKVSKKNYTVEIENQRFMVLKYLKNRKGLYLLVVYAKKGTTSGETKTLQSLQPLMLKAISHDEKYSDKSLALCAEVMEYSQNKLFDQIDAFEPSNLFFWQVPKRIYVRDGVSLVLYRNLRLLHHYKVNYQQKHFAASLHRLRVIMRRSATILETFSSYFDPNIHRFCIDLFLHYHEQTKLLRYLYFLEELCESKEDASSQLLQEIKDLIYEEHRSVSQMLLEQPFQQLEKILTREIQEIDPAPCMCLEEEAKRVVRQHLDDLEKLLQQSKEGHNEEMLEALYASIDALQTLVEDFFHIIGEKKTQIIIDELNILLKPLREYRNCKEREDILKAMQSQSTQKEELDISPLLCTHTQELEEKIAHALRLLRASRFYI
jgi:hypothetical protein